MGQSNTEYCAPKNQLPAPSVTQYKVGLEVKRCGWHLRTCVSPGLAWEYLRLWVKAGIEIGTGRKHQQGLELGVFFYLPSVASFWGFRSVQCHSRSLVKYQYNSGWRNTIQVYINRCRGRKSLGKVHSLCWWHFIDGFPVWSQWWCKESSPVRLRARQQYVSRDTIVARASIPSVWSSSAVSSMASPSSSTSGPWSLPAIISNVVQQAVISRATAPRTRLLIVHFATQLIMKSLERRASSESWHNFHEHFLFFLNLI